jgi:ABC-type branched-subunit amino acid transport system substrate-binding protein
MTIRRRTLLSGAAASIVPAFVPLSSRAAGISDSEIVLGTHLDLSGPVAVAAPPIRNGIQMRIDEANEKGGINGRKIKLIIEDNASQPAQAVRAVEKLLKRDNVFALVAPFGTAPNVATLKRIVTSDVICFAPFGATTMFRDAVGDDERLFTIYPNYDTSSYAGLKWALSNLGAKKVGFIYLEGQFGDVALKGVKQALDERGMTLAVQSGYKGGDIDFSSHVSRMRAAGVDLIFGATAPRETAAVASELKKIKWTDVKFMSATPGRTQIVMGLAKADAEGMYGIGSSPIVPAAQAQGAFRTWVESYKRRFGIEADDAAAQFYGYADWFVTALAATGRDVTVANVVSTLRKSNYKGFGSYEAQHFSRKNHATPEWVQIEKVQNGIWTKASPLINPALTS